MSARARVFSIPAVAPTLGTLVEALLDGTILPGRPFRDDPLSLAELTLLLPSRRAVRGAEAAFLAALGGQAVLLPRLAALPDIDEAMLALADRDEADADPDLPAAVAPADRLFTLMRLVEALADRLAADGETQAASARRAGEAAYLAAALARLFDEAALEETDWCRLADIVPETLDRYFQASARFLKIATEAWPAVLAESGRMDPAVRRVALLERETARIASGAAGPVVAVAAASAVPSLTRLVSAVARANEGALVLPGLDLRLDEASWRSLSHADGEEAANHPQYGLKRLLDALGLERGDVVELPPGGGWTPALEARQALVSEAMRPAATSHLWNARGDRHRARETDGLVLIEAETGQEEALAIALALREAAEAPGRTAALVTPDRVLARRVSSELARWGLRIDDSAGRPLALTPPAIFARLLVETAAEDLAPVTLLATLKHPLAGFGLDRADLRRATLALERSALRGLRPAPGAAGLAAALDAATAPIAPADHDAARDLVERLGRVLAPLADLAGAGTVPLGRMITAHMAVCLEAGGEAFLDGEAGEALGELFMDLAEADDAGLQLQLADYPYLFGMLAGERAVRMRGAAHPRLHIWGPLEARLQSVDRLILGGLVEGGWPREAAPDPWLNRAMRAGLGLPQPERRVGLAAHDFVSAFASGEVFMTRARRAGRDPNVPSRFLQRLTTVLGPQASEVMAERGRLYTDWARAIDRSAAFAPCARPAPRPPLAVRPRRLSVTEIETLVRDPYSIYARHVLRLRPLDELDAEPGPRERGILIHEAIAALLTEPDWPGDAEQRLVAAGGVLLAAYRDHPSAGAFWRPRFEQIAGWFARFESGRRDRIDHVLPEVQGEIGAVLPGGSFTLRGRADRIDLMRDGSLSILDFKTGQPPGKDEVRTGFSPQVLIIAAMARRGVFDPGHRDAPLAELGFVHLKGGDPAGVLRGYSWKDIGLEDAVEDAFSGLLRLLASFDREETPYLSLPRPKWRLRYGDYDHLARIREWSLTAGEEQG